jgi:hypothetical protein
MSNVAVADTNRDSDVAETAVSAIGANWESCSNLTYNNGMMRIRFRMFPRCERLLCSEPTECSEQSQ